MEREPITYYPGDIIRLRLEIEHKPNLRHAQVVFAEVPAMEGALRVTPALHAERSSIRRLETNADGSKTSEVVFESKVPDERHGVYLGSVYQLDRAEGVTAEGKQVLFDLGGLQGLRFRCVAEPAEPQGAVRQAEFLDVCCVV